MIPLLSIALQATAPRVLPQVLMIVSFIAIFYFLLLRPQRKIADQHRAMLEALKKGDEVVTDGGIIGQVIHLTEDRVTIRTAESTKIVVARPKIARVLTAEATVAK